MVKHSNIINIDFKFCASYAKELMAPKKTKRVRIVIIINSLCFAYYTLKGQALYIEIQFKRL